MGVPKKSAKSKPSIKDVAAAAEVSRAAVSLVLNGGEIRISDAKRQRIIDVAREMNYTPHVGARRLAIQRMETIGLALPQQPASISEYNLFEMTHAIAEYGREHNYDTLLHFFNPEDSDAVMNITERVDGSIIVLGRKDSTDLPARLSAKEHPHVILGGGFFAKRPENYVDMDVATGLMVATRHLIQLGHKNIAYVSHTEQSEKLNGYIVALTKAHIPIRKEWIVDVGFTDKDLQRAAQTIKNMDPRPTGLVFTSDVIAIRMMRYLRDAGIRIPHDMSVTGFDNIESASFVTPGLTTVRVPVRKIAEISVLHLVGVIEKQPRNPLQSMLTAELVVRGSSGPPPGYPFGEAKRPVQA